MIDEAIKEYVDSLQKKLADLKQELINNRDSYKNDDRMKEKNFFQKILISISGKNRDYEATKQRIISEYEEKINSLEEEIKKIENDIDKTQDIDVVMYALYKERTDLFKNPTFMTSLIEVDPKYIIYDMTNEDKVYKAFAEKVLSVYSDKMSDNHKGEYNMFISEMDNPRIPEEGKYKIPHMFLFDEIKSYIIGYLNDHKNPFPQLQFSDYFIRDCKYPLSYGKKIEELYLDNSSYLYYAGISNPNNAFLEGYQVNYGKDLSKNFWEAHAVKESFPSLLVPGKYGRDYTIFALVPKDAKDILGSDGGIGQYGEEKDYKVEERHTYLLPEYIVGASGKKNGEVVFIENPLKMNERKKYANHGEASVGSFKYSDATLAEIFNSGKSR